MKKALALLLAGLTAFSVLACAAEPTGSNDTTLPSPSTTAAPVETTAPAVEETTAPVETGPVPNLPDVGDKYKGTELVFVNRDPNAAHYREPWFYAESINGDTINDAVYRRNAMLEEKYGVTIKSIISDNAADQVNTAVGANDDIYDVISTKFSSTGSLALKGYLHDLYNLPYAELDAPWWDSNSVKGMTVNGRLFAVLNDISLTANRSLEITLFNRDLIKEYADEDVYQLVKENKWVLEKMMEIVQKCHNDVNGNQARDDEDVFAILSGSPSGTASTFMVAAGIPAFVTDSEGNISIGFMNERTINLLEFCSPYLKDTNLYRQYGELSPDGDDKYKYGRRLFSADKFAFTFGGVSLLDEFAQNNMESEFGIAPNPKFDAAQENYYHPIDRSSTCLSIPSTNANEDLERLSILLNDLAYMSSSTLVDAYFETIVKLRRAPAPELGEMLEITKNSMYFDVATLYGLSSSDALSSAMSSGNYASTFSRYERILNKSIETLQKQIDAIK